MCGGGGARGEGRKGTDRQGWGPRGSRVKSEAWEVREGTGAAGMAVVVGPTPGVGVGDKTGSVESG